jgi:hypothetical protein
MVPTSARMSGVNEVDGLVVVDCLDEGAIEEGVLDIQLVHMSAPGEGQSQHGVDGVGLHDEAESLIVVHPGASGESSEDS